MHYKEYKTILLPGGRMNIYRGCTHGCIYCDSRSACYQMDHAFEDIEVKLAAPEQLERELKRKRKRCMIGTGSMSDPYMHCEQQLQYTRKCLEAIDRCGFGATLITKSALVLRDLDLLKSINSKSKCVVQMTLTTFDEELCKIIEPNVSTTRERFETLCTLRDNGIPTVVWLSPFLPYINDTRENLAGLLDCCFRAKVHAVIFFGVGLTLREGNREYFYAQLDKYFPGMKQRYIREFGNSYEIMSPHNRELTAMLRAECKAHGVLCDTNEVFGYLQEFQDKTDLAQLKLF